MGEIRLNLDLPNYEIYDYDDYYDDYGFMREKLF
jgi:hypothetical protein